MVRKEGKRKGFSVLEVLIVFLTIAAVGAAGYYVYSNQQGNSVNKSQNYGQITASSGVPVAPAIKSSADLSTAQQALDQTNLDISDSDLAELNQNLADL